MSCEWQSHLNLVDMPVALTALLYGNVNGLEFLLIENTAGLLDDEKSCNKDKT